MAVTQVINARGVQTGAGLPDYWVLELADGRTIYKSGRLDQIPYSSIPGNDASGLAPGNYIRNDQASTNLSGVSTDVADYENNYVKTFGQTMQRDRYNQIISAGATDKLKMSTELMKSGDAILDSNGDVKMNADSIFNKTDDGKNYKYIQFDSNNNIKLNDAGKIYVTKGLLNQDTFNAAKVGFISDIEGVGNYEDPQAAKDKIPDVQLPESLKQIKDLVTSSALGGAPVFDNASVSEYEETIGDIYRPYEDKLKQTVNDRWAALFPEGGGSTQQLQADNQLFAQLDAARKAEALALAKDAYNKEYGEYEYNKKAATDIGMFETNLGQFNTQLEANTAAQTMEQNWDQTKYYTGLDYQNTRDTADRQLAEILAEARKRANEENASSVSDANWARTGVDLLKIFM